MALMVWAYFCPFNPDIRKEILVYEDIVDKLTNPIKYGLKFKGHKSFLKHLMKLKKDDFKCFERIERFRHQKIHRREPRVEMFLAGSHHEIECCIPLTNKKLEKKWDDTLKDLYPRDPSLREQIKNQCHIGGVPYGSFKPRNIVWEYDVLHKDIFEGLKAILDSVGGCLKILSRKPPLKTK